MEALHQLLIKNAVEPVENQTSGLLQPVVFRPQTQQPVETYTGPEQLSNKFPTIESFKMETPETIRTSLQAGQWVTSIDFKDAYFHIPIDSSPSVSTIQPGPTREPVKPEPPCMAPRASAIKEQGFSEAVAARIQAPQRGSTRSVYEAKWTVFTKWCLSN